VPSHFGPAVSASAGAGLHPPASGPVQRHWIAFAIALIAGLGQAASIAAPWDGEPLWWLQLASLAVLAWQVQGQQSPRWAFLLGWIFATAWSCGTFWWLFISMHTYGGLAAPLAVVAVLGLALVIGLYYALICGVFSAVARTSRAQGAIVFAALWLLAELLRATWFTGFPWGESGYAHVEGPLAVLAGYIGVHGLSFLAALVAASVSGWARSPNWQGAVALAMVTAVVVAATLGMRTEQDSRSLFTASHPVPVDQHKQMLSVDLLQGNIPQDEKFQGGTGIPLALNWYAQQLGQSTASLVVAPETAIPVLPVQLPEGYLSAIGQRFATVSQALLIGIPLGNTTEGYTNSAIGIRAGAQVYRYDKHHLVPFGEFIPPLFRWFTDMMNIPLGDFNRGPQGQPSFEWQGQRLALNICYEDLFGEELGVRFADPATAPTVFVNIGNIGWFGDTIAIDQHLAISRMRAMEFERPMVRATNTGATVVIDHHGAVTYAFPPYTRGVLHGQVEGRTGITPYAWWIARLGLWPLWLLALAVAGWAVWRSRMLQQQAGGPAAVPSP
jgi:apolipoprotein N-acyltransferase